MTDYQRGIVAAIKVKLRYEQIKFQDLRNWIIASFETIKDELLKTGENESFITYEVKQRELKSIKKQDDFLLYLWGIGPEYVFSYIEEFCLFADHMMKTIEDKLNG